MHVLIYVLDALRPDHLGCYGYARDTSPHIDALAADGWLLRNAFTVSTWTRPAAASLLTGAYPAAHGVRTRADAFYAAHGLPNLPETLAAHGFATAAFVAMPNLSAALGFARGFADFEEFFDQQGADQLAAQHAAYLAWLAQHSDQPTFALVWSVATHAPFDPPDDARTFSQAAPPQRQRATPADLRRAGRADRQWIIDLYDDAIRANDRAIGELVGGMRERGVYDDALLIVTSDHGEAFYEHGLYAHGHLPHDELLRIPLVLKPPHGHERGLHIDAALELTDIAPWVRRITGVDPSGANTAPTLPVESKARVYSDTQTAPDQNRYFSVRIAAWKYIRVDRALQRSGVLRRLLTRLLRPGFLRAFLAAPRHYLRGFLHRDDAYLYDLVHDPAEQHNVVRAHPEIAASMRAALDAWLAHQQAATPRSNATSLTAEQQAQLDEQLRRLGYLP